MKMNQINNDHSSSSSCNGNHDYTNIIYRVSFTKMHGAGNDFVLFKREDIKRTIVSNKANGHGHTNGNSNGNNNGNGTSNGNGNYSYVPSLDELAYISKSIANRKLGVGCDQVIIVSDSPSSKSDYEMLIFNNDGSQAMMCGNGVRCFSKYITDNRIPSIYNEDGSINSDRVYHDRPSQRVHTLSGIIITYPQKQQHQHEGVEEVEENGKDNHNNNHNNNLNNNTQQQQQLNKILSLTKFIKVNMGTPYILRTNEERSQLLVVDNRSVMNINTKSIHFMKTIYVTPTVSLRCVLVSMGNPHCVIFLKDNQGSIADESQLESMDISYIGRKLESDGLFIDSCNVEFVSVIAQNKLKVRVWERGAGETLACGTGACAVAVASILTGKSVISESISVEMPGGELIIDWNKEDNKVYKTGPATTVYSSEVNII
ncbi:hypothetical protein PPL_01718 [Heterostelium album PN500]|uniref:diaminopimelate epimerase n=1 Tax=Heterostelium pallidum (strain ATCC 26659 / Pp 5 / PN500) TaxID=670386 RepID=D3B0A2_HETP5|nr:hypothetical protein PPL_01718 [Heterostelium album PN500]EFA84726.1 hypothetical protein PPL_01718 [Heterostelium album PN500]|eukprot:XP_020436838.1 hypothetical protein PPL_01718 [Heterostelium album PN500]